MERMLVVVFDEESKAYEGLRALKQLEKQGRIVVYADRVIGKNLDGRITVKHSDYEFPAYAVGGTAIGAIIGLLGGIPIDLIGGAAVGSLAGGLAGSVGDFYRAEVSADFLDEISAALKPGKFALIADVKEERVTPVDIQMEALGASVIRTAKRSFEAEQRAKEVARLRAEIAQLKAELVRAHAGRKAKLQARIDKLHVQLQAQLDQAKQRSEQIKSEIEAKVHALMR